MKIHGLDLVAYGPFTDLSLDLSAGQVGLHVIHGPNEAGKSSALRALIGWLFGIDRNTRDAHLHDMKKLRVGGRLVSQDGHELAFLRRKGNKNTLLDPADGTTIPDQRLARLLPGVDKALFTRLFGIDHRELVWGGQEILTQAGDLGQALFSASLGTAGLRAVAGELEARASELFRPGAHKGSAVLAGVSRYRESCSRRDQAVVTPERWETLQDCLADVAQRLAATEEELGRTRRDKALLERVRGVLGSVAKRRQALAAARALGEVTALPEGFSARRVGAQQRLAQAREQRRRAGAALEKLRVQRDAAPSSPRVLEHAERIEELQDWIGDVRSAAADRPKREGERQRLRNKARDALRPYTPDESLDEAQRKLRPLLARRRRVQELEGRFRELSQSARDAQRGIDDARQEIQELEQALASEAEVLPCETLRSLVGAAQAEGRMDARLAEAMRQFRGTDSTVRRELERLGLWEGGLDAFRTLELPLDETLEAFEDEDRKLRDAERTRAARQEELRQRRSTLEQELLDLTESGEVPTEADLEEARGRRERGWSLIRRTWLGGEEITSEAAEYDGNRPLPEAYEQAVEEADAAADRLRAEAGRVQQNEGLRREAERLSVDEEGLDEQAELAESRRAELDERWLRCWRSCGLEPLSPREMRGWLRGAQKIRDQVDALDGGHAEVEDLSRRVAAHRAALLEELETLGAAGADELVGLEPVLQRCLEVIEANRALAIRREKIESDLRSARQRHGKAQRRSDEVEAELAQWRREWAPVIAVFGLDAEAHPSDALTVLDELAAAFDDLDEAIEVDRRIYGIDRKLEEFDELVELIAALVGFERGDLPPIEVARRLKSLHAEAAQAAVEREGVDRQIEEREAEIADAEATIKQAEAALDSLSALAGVDVPEALEEAERRWAERRDLSRRIAELEEHLLDAGGGQPLAELERQVDGVDPDELPIRIEQLVEHIDRLEQERAEALKEQAGLEKDVRDLDGSARAAEAAEEASEILAGVRSDVAEYLRVRSAGLILEHQIERYRRQNQAPLLKRAGELFSRLTVGSFEALRDDLDDKSRPVLHGVRPDDLEVSVADMSDGTRDQLYLALRLATLEHHMAGAEPMPFVVDDILVGFDDDRTKACLEVLAEVAAETQVILFTHHEAVARQAEELDARAGVFVHRLSPS